MHVPAQGAAPRGAAGDSPPGPAPAPNRPPPRLASQCECDSSTDGAAATATTAAPTAAPATNPGGGGGARARLVSHRSAVSLVNLGGHVAEEGLGAAAGGGHTEADAAADGGRLAANTSSASKVATASLAVPDPAEMSHLVGAAAGASVDGPDAALVPKAAL